MGNTYGFDPSHPVKVAVKNNIVITIKIDIVNISDGLTIYEIFFILIEKIFRIDSISQINMFVNIEK